MNWQTAGMIVVGTVAIAAAFIFLSEFSVFASAVINGRAGHGVAMQAGGLTTLSGTLLLTSAGLFTATARGSHVKEPRGWWPRRWFRRTPGQPPGGGEAQD